MWMRLCGLTDRNIRRCNAEFTQEAPRAERKRRAQQFGIGAHVNVFICSHRTARALERLGSASLYFLREPRAPEAPVVKFGQSRSDQTGSQ